MNLEANKKATARLPFEDMRDLKNNNLDFIKYHVDDVSPIRKGGWYNCLIMGIVIDNFEAQRNRFTPIHHETFDSWVKEMRQANKDKEIYLNDKNRK